MSNNNFDGICFQEIVFKRWINYILKDKNLFIENLYSDLADGVYIVNLIEILTSHEFKNKIKSPNFRSQKMENITMTLKYLQDNENIKFLNIDSSNILDMNRKLILCFIWHIIEYFALVKPLELYFKLNNMSFLKVKSTKQRFITWLKHQLISDFTSSITNSNSSELKALLNEFHNGKLIGALVNKCNANLCPNWSQWSNTMGFAHSNIQLAMDSADQLGIPQFISPAELSVQSKPPDEQSLMTYFSQFIIYQVKQLSFSSSMSSVATISPTVHPTNYFQNSIYISGIDKTGYLIYEPLDFTLTYPVSAEPNVHLTQPLEDLLLLKPNKIERELDVIKAQYSIIPHSAGDYCLSVTLGKSLNIVAESNFIALESSERSEENELDSLFIFKGRGIQQNGIRVGDLVNFTLQLMQPSKIQLFNVLITVQYKDGRYIDMTRKEENNSIFCQYAPMSPGIYEVVISLQHIDVEKSFKVLVGEKCSSQIVAFGHGLKCGCVNHPVKFIVETNGESGTLNFTIEGPNEANIECKDNGDGSASVTFYPTTVGEYAVHILYDDLDIRQSPFMVDVIEDNTYIKYNKVKAYGPALCEGSLSVGQLANFTIDLASSQATMDLLTVDCYDRSGKSLTIRNVRLTDSPGDMTSDTKRHCSLVPSTSVKLSIFISVNGVAISNSPFMIYVVQNALSSKIHIQGPGAQSAVSGKESVFYIDCRQMYQITNTNDQSKQMSSPLPISPSDKIPLAVLITDSNLNEIPCHVDVSSTDRFLFTVRYIPNFGISRCLIDVIFDKIAVFDEPLIVPVAHNPEYDNDNDSFLMLNGNHQNHSSHQNNHQIKALGDVIINSKSSPSQSSTSSIASNSTNHHNSLLADFSDLFLDPSADSYLKMIAPPDSIGNPSLNLSQELPLPPPDLIDDSGDTSNNLSHQHHLSTSPIDLLLHLHDGGNNDADYDDEIAKSSLQPPLGLLSTIAEESEENCSLRDSQLDYSECISRSSQNQEVVSQSLSRRSSFTLCCNSPNLHNHHYPLPPSQSLPPPHPSSSSNSHFLPPSVPSKDDPSFPEPPSEQLLASHLAEQESITLPRSSLCSPIDQLTVPSANENESLTYNLIQWKILIYSLPNTRFIKSKTDHRLLKLEMIHTKLSLVIIQSDGANHFHVATATDQLALLSPGEICNYQHHYISSVTRASGLSRGIFDHSLLWRQTYGDLSISEIMPVTQMEVILSPFDADNASVSLNSSYNSEPTTGNTHNNHQSTITTTSSSRTNQLLRSATYNSCPGQTFDRLVDTIQPLDYINCSNQLTIATIKPCAPFLFSSQHKCLRKEMTTSEISEISDTSQWFSNDDNNAFCYPLPLATAQFSVKHSQINGNRYTNFNNNLEVMPPAATANTTNNTVSVNSQSESSYSYPRAQIPAQINPHYFQPAEFDMLRTLSISADTNNHRIKSSTEMMDLSTSSAMGHDSFYNTRTTNNLFPEPPPPVSSTPASTSNSTSYQMPNLKKLSTQYSNHFSEFATSMNSMDPDPVYANFFKNSSSSLESSSSSSSSSVNKRHSIPAKQQHHHQQHQQQELYNPTIVKSTKIKSVKTSLEYTKNYHHNNINNNKYYHNNVAITNTTKLKNFPTCVLQQQHNHPRRRSKSINVLDEGVSFNCFDDYNLNNRHKNLTNHTTAGSTTNNNIAATATGATLSSGSLAGLGLLGAGSIGGPSGRMRSLSQSHTSFMENEGVCGIGSGGGATGLFNNDWDRLSNQTDGYGSNKYLSSELSNIQELDSSHNFDGYTRPRSGMSWTEYKYPFDRKLFNSSDAWLRDKPDSDEFIQSIYANSIDNFNRKPVIANKTASNVEHKLSGSVQQLLCTTTQHHAELGSSYITNFVAGRTSNRLDKVYSLEDNLLAPQSQSPGPPPPPIASPTIVIYGDGIIHAFVNETAEFFIKTRSLNRSDSVSLSIEGPAKTQMETRALSNGDSVVRYFPVAVGEYILSVMIADRHLDGSPFRIFVQNHDEAVKFPLPPPTSIATTPAPSLLQQPYGQLPPPPAQPQTPAPPPLFSTPNSTGSGNLFNQTTKPSPGTEPACLAPPHNTSSAISALPPSSSKVYAEGPGLTDAIINTSNCFSIFTKHAGPGGLSLSIEGPSKAIIEFKDSKNGACGVSYTVSEPGVYTCLVKFNKKHIHGSPFTINVRGVHTPPVKDTTTVAPTTNHNRTNQQHHFQMGKLCHMRIPQADLNIEESTLTVGSLHGVVVMNTNSITANSLAQQGLAAGITSQQQQHYDAKLRIVNGIIHAEFSVDKYGPAILNIYRCSPSTNPTTVASTNSQMSMQLIGTFNLIIDKCNRNCSNVSAGTTEPNNNAHPSGINLQALANPNPDEDSEETRIRFQKELESIQVYGKGLISGKICVANIFFIEIGESVSGALNVTVDGPSKVEIKCSETDKGFKFSYIPSVVGDYTVTIKYGGDTQIKGSPFDVKIHQSSAASTTATSSSTSSKIAAQAKLASLNLPQHKSHQHQHHRSSVDDTAALGDVAGCKSRHKHTTAPTDKSCGAVTHRKSDTQKNQSKLNKINNVQQPNLPHDGQNSRNQIHHVHNNNTSSSNSSTNHKNHQQQITGDNDSSGANSNNNTNSSTNNLNVGTCGNGALTRSSNHTPCTTNNSHNQLPHQHHLNHQNQHHQHKSTSSCGAVTRPANIDSICKIVCYGSGLKSAQVNKWIDFYVDASKAKQLNHLSISILGPSQPCNELRIQHTGSQRYLVSYKSQQSGTHNAQIKWGNQHLTCSPFQIQVE